MKKWLTLPTTLLALIFSLEALAWWTTRLI